MQRWKSAGLWLAVFSCVGAAGVALRELDLDETSAFPTAQAATQAPIVLPAKTSAPGKARDGKVMQAATQGARGIP